MARRPGITLDLISSAAFLRQVDHGNFMNRTETEASLREQIGDELGRGMETLGKGRVRRWFLRCGMEFGSPWIWWGDIGKLRQESYGGGPHEGVDFALGEMVETGRVEAGTEGLRVPVLTAGRVLWCFADRVGDTVILATDQRFEDSRLIIQYSHIDFENVALGERIEAGRNIGKIKLSANPKSITASHLHVSIALLKEGLMTLPPGEVDFAVWLQWDSESSLVYLDPLELLNPEVKERLFVTGEAANSPVSILIATGLTREDRLRLSRVLARSFPGVRTISKVTDADATAARDANGLLVRASAIDWTLEPGEELSVAVGTRLSGTGYDGLVEAIRYLEIANI
jgi:murein DD-endopeptidase MepM/ murein hydrolase activator NlpD